VSSQSLRVLWPAETRLTGLTSAIGEALAGGPPVAPLPADPVEADRALAMLCTDRPVTEPDAAVIVSTSGSTGIPKGVVLSRSAIRASAEATHQRLGGPGRWLLALPAHYVAGLMVIARAAVAGTAVAQVGSDLSGLAAALDEAPGRSYLSLVPTQLNRGLADPVLTAALTRVDAIVLGGAPASADLLGRAASAGVRVVTSYGMSETCGGCVYDGVPLPGVRVSLVDQAQPDQGRIVLAGPMAFSGYRLRPDLTEQTLIGGGVRTGDRGRLVDGRLQVLGRYDDVIISGGLKIDLAAVERAARDWPALAGREIVIIGLPHADWGTELVAVLEAQGPATPTLPQLTEYLQGRVARHERPKKLIMISDLPRTSSGKVDRRRLTNDLADEAS
jgi:O-succinylbenzoic acid--CoA ligase